MTTQDPAADTGAPGSARQPDSFDRWVADNGTRSTDDPNERQHLEEGPGVRHWWRCIPLESVDRIVDRALAASQPSAAAAQGPGMPDRRALSSAIGATFGDYAGNDIPWPPTQEFSDRVMARLQGLAAIGRYAAAASPDPDPAGAPE